MVAALCDNPELDATWPVGAVRGRHWCSRRGVTFPYRSSGSKSHIVFILNHSEKQGAHDLDKLHGTYEHFVAIIKNPATGRNMRREKPKIGTRSTCFFLQFALLKKCPRVAVTGENLTRTAGFASNISTNAISKILARCRHAEAAKLCAWL